MCVWKNDFTKPKLELIIRSLGHKSLQRCNENIVDSKLSYLLDKI